MRCNAEMTNAVLRATCRLDASAERELVKIVLKRRTYTARSIDRLIKVARTVADLDGDEHIDAGALIEASSYRDVDPTADFLPFEGWVPDEEKPPQPVSHAATALQETS